MQSSTPNLNSNLKSPHLSYAWLLALLTTSGLALTLLMAGRSATQAQNSAVNTALKPKGTLTFTHDIASILYNNCMTCHREGEVAPFSLASYKDAQKRAKQLALVTENHLMPPWKPVSHGEFQDERHLNETQIAIIKQWALEGAKEGNPADLPPPPKFAPGWALGQPDLIVEPPVSYQVGPEGRDIYRCFVVPTSFTEDRYISAMDVHPGNRAIVHHIIAYIDTTGKARQLEAKSKRTDPTAGYTTFGGIGFTPGGMLGGWAPGAAAHRLPAETGILLPKGADIVLEVHYHRDGKPETDRSQVALYVNKGTVQRPFHMLPLVNFWFRIPPGDKNYKAETSLISPADATLMSIFPHMHLLGKHMTLAITMPDKTEKQLIDVPDWDFNWQGFYYYKNPIKIPKGAKITLTAWYDNSTDNPRNPSNPPKATGWGEQTTDEMCLAYLGFTLDTESLLKAKTVSADVNSTQIHNEAEANVKVSNIAFNAGNTEGKPGQEGSAVSKEDSLKSKKNIARVLFFVGTDCPISNTYAPEIKRIIDHYTPQNVAFSLVYPDPDLAIVDAQKHAKAYGYTSPVQLDPGHRLTHQTGVTLTPEVAVLSPEGKLLYRGRIDDLYVGLGQRRYEATKHDLRLALDAIVQGKPAPQRFTSSIGCFIPDSKPTTKSK